jgi:hybrid cluster-associated redox disulfide protein
MTKIIPLAPLAWYHQPTIRQDMREVAMRKEITADSLVQQVVERHPQTILAFNRLGMQCVGCYISPFHTIADCAREYTLNIESLLGELNQALVTKVP